LYCPAETGTEGVSLTEKLSNSPSSAMSSNFHKNPFQS
jgi:hypothetical protein